MTDHDPDFWRDHGVRVVSGAALDLNTPQTPGMTRAAAITHARTGATKLWAGTVTIHPNAKTGAHHHGDLESIIYVPAYVPHQEINAARDEPLQCVLVRSGQEPVVVNLDIEPAEAPEEVAWVDSIHPAPEKKP